MGRDKEEGEKKKSNPCRQLHNVSERACLGVSWRQSARARDLLILHVPPMDRLLKSRELQLTRIKAGPLRRELQVHSTVMKRIPKLHPIKAKTMGGISYKAGLQSIS